MSKVINPEKYIENKGKIIDFVVDNSDKLPRGFAESFVRRVGFNIPLVMECFDYAELELFSKFGILCEEKDLYKQFSKILRDRGLLRGNILEVGAGFYPRLGEVIMEDKPAELVRITSYDPELIVDTMSGVKLVKEPFTKSTNLDDVGTIIGMFPCGASRLMIDRAINENKNLLLAFCGCDHSDNEISAEYGDLWADAACRYYKEKCGDDMQIFSWSNEVELSYPIMEYKAPQLVKKD